MYHLLIERVSTVTIEFLQYRARVRIGLNRAGIERAVERTGLFTSLDRDKLCGTLKDVRSEVKLSCVSQATSLWHTAPKSNLGHGGLDAINVCHIWRTS
jgi:hypothetical protein